MRRAWEDEFGHPELPDAAQALELRGGNQRPRKLIDRPIALEDDQAVYGITQPLGARGSHLGNISGTIWLWKGGESGQGHEGRLHGQIRRAKRFLTAVGWSLLRVTPGQPCTEGFSWAVGLRIANRKVR